MHVFVALGTEESVPVRDEVLQDGGTLLIALPQKHLLLANACGLHVGNQTDLTCI